MGQIDELKPMLNQVIKYLGAVKQKNDNISERISEIEKRLNDIESKLVWGAQTKGHADGESVATSHGVIPGEANKTAEEKQYGFKKMAFGFGGFALVVIIVYLGGAPKQNIPASSNAGSAAAAHSELAPAQQKAPQAAPRPPSTPIPRMQQDFIGVINDARRLYSNADNNMAKGSARPIRATELCNLLPPGFMISDWIGTVTLQSTNGEGRGVLGVDIGSNIKFETSNNSFSDILTPSLIEPGSEVHRVAMTLKRGQKIMFGGRLFSKRDDCVHETSITMDGSITKPAFAFQFTELAPLK